MSPLADLLRIIETMVIINILNEHRQHRYDEVFYGVSCRYRTKPFTPTHTSHSVQVYRFESKVVGLSKSRLMLIVLSLVDLILTYVSIALYTSDQ